jgi:hypothetical protein
VPIESKKNGDIIRNPDQPVVIRHQRVTVIRDDDSVLDAQGAEFGIRGHDGCHEFRLENLDIINAAHGTRMTFAEDGVIVGCVAAFCGGEGFQGGYLRRLQVLRCVSNENGWGLWGGANTGISEDRSHGFYWDCSGGSWEDYGLLMADCSADHNDGMGLHLRGRYHTVERCDFTRNLAGQNVGAGDVQLTSVAFCRLVECRLDGGNSGITLYNENGPCQNVEMVDSAIWAPEGGFATSAWQGAVLKVTRGLVVGAIDKTRPDFSAETFVSHSASPAADEAYDAWMGEFRGEEPEPPEPEPPEPEPPPADEDLVTALEESIEAQEAALAETQEALEIAEEQQDG